MERRTVDSRSEAPSSRPPQVIPEQIVALVESSDDAIISKDRRGIMTSWNAGAERMYGYSREEAVGRPVSILIPPERHGEEQRILDRILAGERVQHYETERVTKDGSRIFVSLTVSPMRDANGLIVGASVIARDITDRHRSRLLAERLQELTTALSRELTPARTVEVLLEHTMIALDSDAGAVGLLDQDGHTVELVASRGFTPPLTERWLRFDIDDDVPMTAAMRQATPIWSEDGLELRARFQGLADVPPRFRALAVIPLLAGGRAVGSISLSFTAAHSFTPEEKAFLGAVAQLAGQAIERARLYEVQRHSSERLAFLAEASAILAGSLDPEEALQRLADLAVRHLADWCAVELIGNDGELRDVAIAHVDPDQVRFAREFRARYPTDPEAEIGVPQVIRSGQSELYPEITEEMLVASSRDEDYLDQVRRLGLVAAMIVPLRARGKVFGAVTFVASESGRRYDDDDLRLAEDLARRAAIALDNAMLFQREHEAATTLQRALLPQSLPRIDGIELAAHYDPAGPGIEVGGDWYEVVPLADGRVALTIGDVAGRGVRGASVMGRARTALHAYVLDGYGPAETVERLDRLIKDTEPPEMITLLHLHFDPATGTAEYVRAGHLPAFVRLPDGGIADLDGGGTPPLGMLPDMEYRSHRAQLEPGSTLLLYTDGLIERRGEDLGVGLQRLREAFAGAPEDPGECLAWLQRQFYDEAGPPDDVAMLAMSYRA